ncbi:AAA-ATPase-like domain-containing protein [Jimgerdemannia flammicorona]|uniref:AAA-ATPase-like domain-containing protein n=1 Tax=Jimgerdemannia flammicorona TaxID=994334 RepID=A0A433A382_9FUNG|nr:AAA-ATPase-like domain-containing protein [Jimgerdemannia flammicorona]
MYSLYLKLFPWPEPCRVPVLGANNAALLPGDKLGVGNSDFKELAASRFSLVDKSILIAELCDVGDKVTLVLRPRRFGKTTNLSMLRLFFERIDGESKHEHELRRALFGSMKIAKERPDVMMNEFGKYPVVFLSLKDVTGKTWNDMSRLMRTTISQIYNEHTYLREHLNINEKAKFDRIVNEDSSQSFEFALRELMVFLARYHQQKCIVLIDEYDAPISSAYHNGYYEDAMHFLRPMLSSLLKFFGKGRV